MAPRSTVLLSLAIVLITFDPWAVSASCQFPAIFNFGDSNSDTGGLSAMLGQLDSPYGETYFDVPVGRYSNGRLIVDFMAESLGLPHLAAYLNSMGTNFSNGANFATALSPILAPEGALSLAVSPISLDFQLREFKDFHRVSQIIRKRGGVFGELMPKEDYFSRALYTFDIGQNDLTYSIIHNTWNQFRDYIPVVLSQFKSVVKSVHTLGGRSFWIHNTGPLGCLPAILEGLRVTTGQVYEYGCAVAYNELSKFFNVNLRETVQELREELPEAAITYVDVYSVKYTLITQAKTFGFVEPLKACCGYGGKYSYSKNAKCGEKLMVNGTEILVGSCKDPSVRISWDGTHYTEAANEWVFKKIESGAYSDPPIPLNEACWRHPA